MALASFFFPTYGLFSAFLKKPLKQFVFFFGISPFFSFYLFPFRFADESFPHWEETSQLADVEAVVEEVGEGEEVEECAMVWESTKMRQNGHGVKYITQPVYFHLQILTNSNPQSDSSDIFTLIGNTWSESWCPHDKYHFLYPKCSKSLSICSGTQVKP